MAAPTLGQLQTAKTDDTAAAADEATMQSSRDTELASAGIVETAIRSTGRPAVFTHTDANKYVAYIDGDNRMQLVQCDLVT